MPLVVDASLVFRLLVPNAHQARLRDQMDQWRQTEDRLAAPSLWLYELASALVKAVHFDQLTEGEARRALRLVHGFPIDLITPDRQLTEAAFDWSLRLQRANAYDSFYLALAEALGSELWTADRRLVNAAQQKWVKCPID